MMIQIVAAECRPDTYVGCPAPGVELPDCEHGWEIGNGTAVCSTTPPAPVELATTGGDATLVGAAYYIGLPLLVGGLIVIVSHYVKEWRKRREERR